MYSDRIYSEYREQRTDSYERRIADLQRKRGAYVSPGPNHVWHMDGYLKLVNYGIEMYAAIDGYSRFILWIYIGVSARTAGKLEPVLKSVILTNGLL